MLTTIAVAAVLSHAQLVKTPLCHLGEWSQQLQSQMCSVF